MKPYSSDLRERIIASHEEGISIRKLAKQFKVSRGMGLEFGVAFLWDDEGGAALKDTASHKGAGELIFFSR